MKRYHLQIWSTYVKQWQDLLYRPTSTDDLDYAKSWQLSMPSLRRVIDTETGVTIAGPVD